MRKRIALIFACVALAAPAWADTLVSWQADGQVNSSHPANALYTAAPPGSSLSVTLTFNPAQSSPTFGGGLGCMSVPVSAAVLIGGYGYTSTGTGFTNARLPGTTCSPGSGVTQFSLDRLQQPNDSPWSRLSGGVLIFDYRDLLIRDAFPNQPNTGPGIDASLFYTPAGSGEFASWTFSGGLTFREVDQPAPVPEPATLTLLGLGLAAVSRVRSRNARAKNPA